MLRARERTVMPNARQLRDMLVEEAGELAIDEAIARTSVAEAEKELAEAGFDIRAERARASALIAELTGDRHLTTAAGQVPADSRSDGPTDSAVWVRGPEPVSKRASVRRASPKLVWLAAALAAAATTGGVLYAVGHPEKPQDKPIEPPHEVPPAPTTSASPAPVAPTTTASQGGEWP